MGQSSLHGVADSLKWKLPCSRTSRAACRNALRAARANDPVLKAALDVLREVWHADERAHA